MPIDLDPIKTKIARFGVADEVVVLALVAEVESLRAENLELRGAVVYTLRMVEGLHTATKEQLQDWLTRARSALGAK